VLGIERALSSTDRAPDFGSGGWGFESLRARQLFQSVKRI
jgi:23S rRNA G2445 N2-methylase RlmL